jgi:tetratricopeptide (TPR) repeat protein
MEFRQEELEQAVALSQKALALDPTTTSAYRLLAFINMYKRRYDLALRQIGHALEINPSDVDGTIRAETFWCERAEQGRQCRGSLRFDRGRLLTANSLCWAHYFLCRYNEAVETADRAFSRGPGSSVEMITHSFLAAAYGEMGRSGCRGRTRSSCFCPSF